MSGKNPPFSMLSAAFFSLEADKVSNIPSFPQPYSAAANMQTLAFLYHLMSFPCFLSVIPAPPYVIPAKAGIQKEKQK
jgi:hypothetical protein